MSVPSRPLASRAGLLLASEGVTQQQLATRLGVTRRAVGFYLDGRTRPHPGLPAALRDLVGDEVAARVLDAVPLTPIRARSA